MNIAYILNSSHLNEGSTKAFWNMLKGLADAGVKPFVVLPDKGGVYPMLVEMNIPVLVMTYRLNTYSYLHCVKDYLLFIPRMIAKIAANHRAASKLATFVKENHIDIIHTNVGLLSIGYRAARMADIPHIYHIREYGDLIGYRYFPTNRSFRRQLAWQNNYTICITKGIQSHYNLTGNARSRVIYDGVHDIVTQMPSEEKKYFLYAGRIQPVKGLDILLAAYSDYAKKTDNPIPLYVAGSTIANKSFFAKQQSFVSEQGLEKHISFLGERNDVGLLMRKAVATIIPSRFEGFGLCLPEAMLNGSLTIAHDTAGLKEQMDNGRNIEGQEISLRYETTGQLTALLLEVANCPRNCYAPYIERAFRVVNLLYTTENNARQIYNCYQDIAGR